MTLNWFLMITGRPMIGIIFLSLEPPVGLIEGQQGLKRSKKICFLYSELQQSEYF